MKIKKQINAAMQQLSVQFFIYARLILPLVVALLFAVTFFTKTLKGQGDANPIVVTPDMKDFFLKRIDAFIAELQAYLGMLLAMLAATLTITFLEVRKHRPSYLHIAMSFGLWMAFFYGFFDWFVAQSYFQGILAKMPVQFHESDFGIIRHQMHLALMWEGVFALFLLGVSNTTTIDCETDRH